MFNSRLEAGFSSFSLDGIDCHFLMETNTLLGPVSELKIRSRPLQFHVLFMYLIALFIVYLNDAVRGVHSFQKYGCHLKILHVRKVT